MKHPNIKRMILALAAASALTLSACGTNNSGNQNNTPPAMPTVTPSESNAPAAGDMDLKVLETRFGSVLVAKDGKTVYFYTKDKKDSGKSACTGKCLEQWPPVTTTNKEPKTEGVDAEVGTIETPDGQMQVTVDGQPVYFWIRDKNPGDTTGQGVGDVWYVIAPDGSIITTPAPAGDNGSNPSTTMPIEPAPATSSKP